VAEVAYSFIKGLMSTNKGTVPRKLDGLLAAMTLYHHRETRAVLASSVAGYMRRGVHGLYD
jgi:hypothetical protein